MQTHTMKYNLIFGGIEQTALDYEEDTEAKTASVSSLKQRSLLKLNLRYLMQIKLTSKTCTV